MKTKKKPTKATSRLIPLGTLVDYDDDFQDEPDFSWGGAEDFPGCCGLSVIEGFEVSERVADGKTSITVFDPAFINDLRRKLPETACLATTIFKVSGKKAPERYDSAINAVLKELGFVKQRDFLGNSGNHLRLWMRVPPKREIPKA